jgi:aconitase B
MARYTVGARAAGAGSATLPIGSLYSAAAVNPRVREIGVFTTVATGGFTIALCRLTTTGTQGAALSEQGLDGTATASSCQAFNTHTVAPTIIELGHRKTMGAAIGDGVIWTFANDIGLNAAVGTANGVGLYVVTGTGQICDWYIVWDE